MHKTTNASEAAQGSLAPLRVLRRLARRRDLELARGRGRKLARAITSPWRALPDFLIIGAQRAGTSTLWRYLIEHPDVLPPVYKEIYFFDRSYRRGVPWYRLHFPRRSRLEAAGGQTGEATPSYLFHPHVPARVAETLPAVGLIALLRDPVDRAYSHYRISSRSGVETLPFVEAIEREPERLEADLRRLERGERTSRSFLEHSYVARGQYAEQLERWQQFTTPSQLLVLETRELAARPLETYARALEFLGLPIPDRLPEFRAYHVNTHPAPELPAAAREILEPRFAASNQRVFELTGIDFRAQ